MNSPQARFFTLLQAALLCWIVPLTVEAAEQPATRRPNIIYIMTDDLGYGDLGCYGQQVIATPYLDQMATEGMRFTDHYAGHTVCRPSRLVLWLGQHTGTTGLIGNRPRELQPGETTVAGLLKSVGYKTGGVGKWALGDVETPDQINTVGHPNNHGFDYWFGYLSQSDAHNFYPRFLWENKQQVTLPGNALLDHPQARGRVSKVKESYSHHYLTDRALKFIRDNQDDPFLLHIHWTIPHANNEAGRVHGDGMEIPDYGIYANTDWPNPEKGFAAMIALMDRDVGRIFSLLKELDLDEQTIVFFTSDNGPHQEGGHKHDFFNSNGPLKGFKRSMHEGGIRVPLIVRWPGQIEPGTVSDHRSAFWDFVPTACELAGVSLTAETNGISYLPTLLGHSDQQQQHEYLFWASQEGETSIGVRMENWKLVQYRPRPNQPKATEDWRLYNLSKDLGEQTNLANQHPEIVQTILDLLERDGLKTLDTSR